MQDDKKEIWNILAQYDYPNRPGLDYINEFTCLVAIILSARMRDDFLNTQTPALFKAAPNEEKMAQLGVDGIAQYLRKIGLWHSKAQNVCKLSKQLIELKKIKAQKKEKEWYDDLCQKASLEDDPMGDMHIYGDIISDNGIPSFRLGLIQLAGVGRKTANVFLNQQYSAPVFPVDTHVRRVTNRIGLVDTDNAEKIEIIMHETVQKQYRALASTWLVWHGRRVCQPRNPKCSTCLLKNYCNYFKKIYNGS